MRRDDCVADRISAVGARRDISGGTGGFGLDAKVSTARRGPGADGHRGKTGASDEPTTPGGPAGGSTGRSRVHDVYLLCQGRGERVVVTAVFAGRDGSEDDGGLVVGDMVSQGVGIA